MRVMFLLIVLLSFGLTEQLEFADIPPGNKIAKNASGIYSIHEDGMLRHFGVGSTEPTSIREVNSQITELFSSGSHVFVVTGDTLFEITSDNILTPLLAKGDFQSIHLNLEAIAKIKSKIILQQKHCPDICPNERPIVLIEGSNVEYPSELPNGKGPIALENIKDTLYAISIHDKVFKSIDGGNAWEMVASLNTPAGGRRQILKVNEYLYFVHSEIGIFKLIGSQLEKVVSSENRLYGFGGTELSWITEENDSLYNFASPNRALGANKVIIEAVNIGNEFIGLARDENSVTVVNERILSSNGIKLPRGTAQKNARRYLVDGRSMAGGELRSTKILYNQHH